MSGVSLAQASWIRAHRHALATLPAPDVRWTRAAVADRTDATPDPRDAQFPADDRRPPDVAGVELSPALAEKAEVNETIRRVDRVYASGRGYISVYRTDRAAFDYLQEKLAEAAARDGLMPCCGSDGVCNERGLEVDGEAGLRCPACGAVHARSEVAR